MNDKQLLKWFDEFMSLAVGYLKQIVKDSQKDAGYLLTASSDEDPIWSMWYTGEADENGNPVYIEKEVKAVRVTNDALEILCDVDVISGHASDWDWRTLVNDDAILLEPTLKSLIENIGYYLN